MKETNNGNTDETVKGGIMKNTFKVSIQRISFRRSERLQRFADPALHRKPQGELFCQDHKIQNVVPDVFWQLCHLRQG